MASDGVVHAFGDAVSAGSLTSAPSLPVKGMAATPSGNGYWLVASDGGLFAFGDAAFHGSTGAMTLNKPIVAMAATPLGGGYWLVASDGGMFSFGDAAFHGAFGPTGRASVVGIATTPRALDLTIAGPGGGIPGVPVTPTATTHSPPTAAVTAGPNSGSISLSASPTYSGTATGNGSGIDKIQVSVDGGAFSVAGVTCTGCNTASATWNFTPVTALAEGGHSVAFRAVDNAGSFSAVVTRTVTVDTVVPTVAVTVGPADSSTVASARPSYSGTAGGTGSGVQEVDVRVGGGAFSTTGVTCTGCPSPSATWSYTPGSDLTDGPHTLTFRSLDLAGNISAGVVRTVTVDTTRPTFALLTAVAANPVVTATFSEPILCSSVHPSGDQFLAAVVSPDAVTGASCPGTASAAISITLANAAATGDIVSVQLVGPVTDSVGNPVSVPTTKTTVATNVLPTVTVTAGPPEAAATGVASPTYSGTAGDTDGVVSALQVRVDAGAFSTNGVTCSTCPTASATWSFTPVPALTDGTHSLTFRAVDNANGNSVDVTRTVTVDTVVPTVAITFGPADAAAVASGAPTYSGNAGDVGTGVKEVAVSVDAGVFSTTGVICTGCATAAASWTWTPSPTLTDAPHTLVFRSVDLAGNVSVDASRTVTVDTTAPVVAITAGPTSGSATNSTTPTYSGTAADGGTGVAAVQVSVNGATSTASGVTCTGCTPASATATWTFTPVSLAEGTYTFAFQSFDPAGNVSATASRTVTVDTIAPIFVSVSAVAANPVVTATFSEPILCSSVHADGGQFIASLGLLFPDTVTGATCSGPAATVITLTLANAPATGDAVWIRVTGVVTDPATNPLLTLATQWATATNALPTLAVTSGPDQGSASASAKPAYAGTAGDTDGVISAVQVSVDGAPATAAACSACGTASATWTFTPAASLGDGVHTLTFQAVDNAAGLSTAVSRTVLVDTLLPTVAITVGPADASATNSAAPTYSGSAGDAGSGVQTVQVSVDGTPFTAVGVTCGTCNTASTAWSWAPGVALADGLHTVAFRSIDVAGNISTSASRTVTVDTVAPTVTVGGGPADASATNVNTPTYSGSAGGTGSGVQEVDVKVDSGAFTANGVTCPGCTTASATATWSFTPGSALADGPHTFTFRSLDVAGNTSAGVIRTLTVDTVVPTFNSIIATGGSPSVTAVFSEPVLCSSLHANGDQFLATVLALPDQITGATCSGTSSTTVVLTLANAPATGNPVTVQLKSAVTTVTDPAGNHPATPTNKATVAL